MAKKKWFETDEPGSLKEHDYSVKNSERTRHQAIREAIEDPDNDALEVFHKLDGLSKVTKNSQPSNSRKYRSDANWIRKNFL